MRRPRRSLLARLVALGLAQLAALALVSIVVGWATLRPSAFEHHHRRLAKPELVRLAAHLDDRAALARDVASLLEERELEVTVFDARGRMLASNVSPPLRLSGRHDEHGPPDEHRPPDEPGRRHDEHGPGHAGHGPRHGPPHGPPPPQAIFFAPPGPPRHSARYALFGTTTQGTAVSRPSPDPWRFLPAILTFLGSVFVVTIASLLLARSIAGPLGALAGAAKRFGSGDLRARARPTRDDEIGEVGRAFDEMADRIERLVRAEKELLANVSHELRTPLSRIRVALDLASEGDAETARESLAEIAVDLAELEDLVGDVLVAARLAIGDPRASASSLVRSLAPCDASAIAERAAERFRAHHRERVFALELAPSETPILGDAALLRRAIDNLLENAAKYSPELASPIRLVVAREAEKVRFEVHDRGIGIADEDLPFVFEPFFRADRSRTRATGGVGLGLALAKRIVEAHGGTIRIASTRDAGTTVTVELPLRSSID